MTCLKFTVLFPQYSFWALALPKVIDPVIHLVHLGEEGAGQYLRKQIDIIGQSSRDTKPLVKQVVTMDDLSKDIYKLSFISTYRILVLTVT